MIVMFELKGIWCVCANVYVCVGFQESSFLIICARTAEDYDDDVDKRMTTSTGESPSSFSSCRLSLWLLTLCHSRLDQQADRWREGEDEEEKIWKERTYELSILLKHTPTFMHACVSVCLRNDAGLSIMLEFCFLYLPRLLSFEQTYINMTKRRPYIAG